MSALARLSAHRPMKSIMEDSWRWCSAHTWKGRGPSGSGQVGAAARLQLHQAQVCWSLLQVVHARGHQQQCSAASQVPLHQGPHHTKDTVLGREAGRHMVVDGGQLRTGRAGVVARHCLAAQVLHWLGRLVGLLPALHCPETAEMPLIHTAHCKQAAARPPDQGAACPPQCRCPKPPTWSTNSSASARISLTRLSVFSPAAISWLHCCSSGANRSCGRRGQVGGAGGRGRADEVWASDGAHLPATPHNHTSLCKPYIHCSPTRPPHLDAHGDLRQAATAPSLAQWRGPLPRRHQLGVYQLLQLHHLCVGWRSAEGGMGSSQ